MIEHEDNGTGLCCIGVIVIISLFLLLVMAILKYFEIL